jgi:hypothetical protein
MCPAGAVEAAHGAKNVTKAAPAQGAKNATQAAPTQGSKNATAPVSKNATAAAPVAKAVQAGRLLRRMLMGECCSFMSLMSWSS